MNRLDRHVNAVRTKLFLGTLLKSLAWAFLVFGAVVLGNILVDRFLAHRLPHWVALFWTGVAVSVAVAFAYTFWRRPTPRQAAVAIDEKLGLKEKFSTALYVRPLNDPFAAATVRDAEMTADNVSLQKRFPVQLPRPGLTFSTLAVVLAALLAGRFLGPHPLFADDDAPAKKPQANSEKMTPENKKLVAQAIAEVENTPVLTAEDKTKVEAAKRSLEDLKNRPTHDAVAEQRSALKAMTDMQAIKDKVKEIKDKAVQAKSEAELFRNNSSQNIDDTGPLGDVQKELAKGDFSGAAKKLDEALDKFDKMKPEDQAKAAEQMKKFENQLKQIAQNPNVQRQIANQLQNMGATPQQLQQLANAAQAAANGDPQAQQKVQQLANQIAQAANQQAGLTPQQQKAQSQQIQNMVKQMQGNANAQQAAQGMANAAGALAKQMAAQAQANAGAQQGQQGAGKQGGQQSQSASTGGKSTSGQSGQGSAQTPGGSNQQSSQANSQQSGGQGQQQGQQGSQAGQGQGNQGTQSMADAKAEMQRQLRDLQDAADQAAEGNGQMADAQQGEQGNDGQGQGQGQGQGEQANKGNANGNQGAWDKGDPNGQGGGSGGPGVSAGGPRPAGIETPVGFDKKVAASEADERGKFNTVRWVKAMSEKGSSKIGMSNVVEQAEKDSADEVDQDRITRSEQAVVKRYFDDLKSSQAGGQGAAPAAGDDASKK